MPRAVTADAGTACGPAEFAAALAAEHDALGALVSLLLEEQEILVQGDADRLALSTPDKTARINQLAVLGERRNRHLASQDLACSAEGMTTWLARNPDFAASVGRTWKELLARAESARQINQGNGLLIDARMQQNRLKLAVLQMASASDGVYRPDGRLRPLRRASALLQV